jgi:transcriptional regulator with XRE-family HTH domain
MTRKEVVLAVQNALQNGPFSLHQLADKAGVGYETLRQWAAGKRNPKPDNVDRILTALDEQADEIKQLVAEARALATPPE